MRFIKLTDKNGEAIYIDADLIQAIRELKLKDSPRLSCVDLSANTTYYVQESPEAIIALIEQKGE